MTKKSFEHSSRRSLLLSAKVGKQSVENPVQSFSVIKVCVFRDTTDVLGLFVCINAVNAKPRYFGWQKRMAICQAIIFAVLQDEENV